MASDFLQASPFFHPDALAPLSSERFIEGSLSLARPQNLYRAQAGSFIDDRLDNLFAGRTDNPLLFALRHSFIAFLVLEGRAPFR
jgi:hypothetical protein